MKNKEFKSRAVRLSDDAKMSLSTFDIDGLSDRDYAKQMLRGVCRKLEPGTTVSVVESHHHKVGRSWVTDRTELGKWTAAELMA